MTPHTPHHRTGLSAPLLICLTCLSLVLSLVGFGVPSPLSGTDSAQAAEVTQAAQTSKSVDLSVTAATAIITATSGFKASISIENSSGENLEEGTLTFRTSTRSFSSSKSMQDWADGTLNAPTPLLLESAKVKELKSGEATTVSIDLAQDDAALASIRSWGAKPLIVQYVARNANKSTVRQNLRTYVTRSHDGLKEKATPQINITTAMPLSSVQRSLKKDALKNIIADPAASEEVTQPSKEASTELETATKLASAHSSLQVVADPGSIGSATGLQQSSLAAIMQPYGFDLTARSAFSEEAWKKAGITDTAWNAGTAHSLANAEITAAAKEASADDSQTDASGSASASPSLKVSDLDAVAWEGEYSWNAESLELAKKQGYSTVVSETGDHSASSDVITGRTTVATSEGDVTVLVAEQTLSSLVQGNATDADAQAEQTQAGRLARFVAQTALFQMQRPYVNRTLLVSLGKNLSQKDAAAILSALESSDWVKQTSLKDLIANATDATNPDVQPDTAASEADFTLDTVKPTSEQLDEVRAHLTTLSATTSSIERIKNSVLKESVISQDDTSDENNDPQALSRQNAKESASDKVSALEWLAKLHSVHQDLGLLSFGGTQSVRDSMLSADKTLNTNLLNSVSIIPPSRINVFSESAQTPTTVKNQLPFPVSIRIHAATNSNAIGITKVKDVEVGAGSEAQATFDIHVVGMGSATATFTPTDRAGNAFGAAPTTTIYSQLTINDMSGNILIILALILGALGIYRQATRRKDPDQ